MIRVCCVFGTWQLVTLIAALLHVQENGPAARSGLEDYLVVYETGGVPESFQQILHRMAEAIWPWKRIVWAYDLLTDERRFNQRQFASRIQTLQERVGVDPESVGEVWVCWLNRPAEKLVFYSFPNARIVLYEDGLISYIPIRMAAWMTPESYRRNRFRRFWFQLREAWEDRQPVWRFRRSRSALDPRHLERVTGAYLQLTPEIPPPEALAAVPRQFVDYSLLHEALGRVRSILPALPEADTDPAQEAGRILVLGHALSRNGTMPREKELGIYCEIVDNILRKGYRVLWKEHPRISIPFFDELKEHVRQKWGAEYAQRVQQLSLPHAYPVELAAERLKLAGCVTGTSAAPFYLRRLYDISCYTFAEVLLPYMEGVDLYMSELVRREAPSLSHLPALAAAAKKGKASV